MAVISAKLTACSGLYKNIGTYGTADILNSGETYNSETSTVNEVYYTFKITGLKDHTTKNVIVRSLLLNADGSLATTKKFKIDLNGTATSVNLIENDAVKTIVPTAFSYNQLQETDELELKITVNNQSNESCYFGLQSLIINLLDVNLAVQLTFTGPNTSRTISNITVATLLINRDAEVVTFSKDPTSDYDSTKDTITGMLYLKKNGIFVDGYLYGVNAIATDTKSGIVRLSQSSFTLEDVTDEEGNVIGQSIVAPTESGVAATSLLVFNALATAKLYTDDLLAPILTYITGINAPMIMNIEDNEGNSESLGDEITYSNDFKKLDKKLYINWIELT